MYSHSKLKQDIISNFQLLKQPDFLEALKVRWKNGGNVPHLEIDEVVLIYYNVNNSCQQNSRVLHTFVPHKSFGQLLNILPQNIIFSKTFEVELSYMKVWFAVQNSNLREIEDKINIILVIN